METDSNFDDLMQQAQQLVSSMDGEQELPRVERNLRQIVDMGLQLWNRTALPAGRKDATDVKASILLGSRGLDLPKISQKLETLSVAKTFEPLEPVAETDVEGFLRNEKENAILSIIEESRISAFKNAEKLYWEHLQNEWEQEKQKILQSMMEPGSDFADINLDTEMSVTLPIGIHTRSAMDNVEMSYSSQIYIYNEEIIQGGNKPDIIEKFCQVATKLDDKNIIDLWTMVRYMVEVPVLMVGNNITARTSSALQNVFASQARKYLEENYVHFIKANVYGNLRLAQLGGVPGTYHLVRSFLHIKKNTSKFPDLEDGMVDGQPIWALIYYCLRCGDFKASLHAASMAGPPLEDYRQFLEEYIRSGDKRLTPQSESNVQIMYRRNVKSSKDPFKRACFCIIACCDINDDHHQVADKIDDYLWLRFCQIRTDDDVSVIEPSHVKQDYLTLFQFQQKLLEEYGETHFRAFEQPFLYFQVLFLSAQFEAAVDFLARVDRLRSHAVHVAIALFESKLLLIPSSIQVPLLTKEVINKSPVRKLNFAKLIILYTRKFEASDPREALQYFYLLRDITGSKGENLFLTCVSELVLETREFDMLLGHMESNGVRRHGLVDKFQGDSERIIELVAVDSENRGLLEDAVKMFDLVKKHDKVLKLLTTLLGQVVTQPNVAQSKRDRIQKMAIEIAERYRTLSNTGNQDTTKAFYLLLDLMTFFDLYHAEKPQEAFNVLKQIKLLPFSQSEVERYVGTFRWCSDEIRRNFPEILIATMNILYSLYTKSKASSTSMPKVAYAQNDNFQHIEILRKQAQTLITFAGMLPYCMPGDTVSRLVQKEMLMH